MLNIKRYELKKSRYKYTMKKYNIKYIGFIFIFKAVVVSGV